MIVVKVELWHYGAESKKRLLGVGYIANAGHGNGELGEYTAAICNHLEEEIISEETLKVHLSKFGGKGTWRRGEVSGFKRKTRGGWDLLYLALKGIIGRRNEDGS